MNLPGSLKIVFAGTPEFGLPCLNAIAQSGHHLHAAFTQPDRPAGRGRKLQVSAVKNWALAHGVPVYQPLNFKESETVEQLAALEPDVLVVIAYGLILPKKVLSIPKFACINVHASILPRWRGASPIQQAILHGDQYTGVTIMQMDVGMDTGDSLLEVVCPIEEQDTAGTLHDKLAQLAVKPLLATLDALVADELKPAVQDDALATYAAKITKQDALINWQDKAIDIDRQVRAFNPWPVAYTHAGNDIMRIHQAKVDPVACNALPGTVLAMDKSGLKVATGSHILCVQQVQFPGGRVVSIADCLNAGRSPLFVNLILGLND